METTRPAPQCSTVIWDVGGTLVDRVVGQTEAVERALQAVGVCLDQIEPLMLERARQHYIRSELLWSTPEEEEHGFLEIAALLLERSTVRAEAGQVARLGQVLGELDWVYRPVPGIPELLRELHDLGIRQAIASNWPPSLPRFLRHHALLDHFAVVVGSGAERCRKPDPLFYRRVLEHVDVAPGDAVFIGNDPQFDILPARAAGLATIHFDPRRQHDDADAHDVPALRQLLLPLLGLDRPH